MSYRNLFFLLCFLLSALDGSITLADPSSKPKSLEFFVDAVVASVDGKPITLQDVCARLNPPRFLDLKSASMDPEVGAVLDGIILEKLVTEEAETKKIGVSEGEIDAYVDEIASKNGLSKQAFQEALTKENRDFAGYKEQVKVEILRSKLISSYVQRNGGVTSEDLENYVKEHPELSRSGKKVKLSQILIGTENRTEDEAKKITTEIRERLVKGENFGKLAAQFSESPDGREGGSLGVVAEEDLNHDILEAILALEEGKFSDVVRTTLGYQLFWVEKRFVEKVLEDEKLQQELKEVLKRRLIEGKLENYFTTELFKLHSVDRKI